MAAKPHGGGQPLKADARTIVRLEKLVSRRNDLTYDEYHQHLGKAGATLSRASVGRLLRRLDLTRKKRRASTLTPAASG